MPRPAHRNGPPPTWEKTGEMHLGALAVHRHRLPNGLTVLTCPDPSALTVAYMTWFSVGSRDEEAGQTGLAHLFEHLMFTQTKTQREGAFDATIESAGGNSNAHTSQDATAYIDVVPAAALPTVIALEADRMLSLDLRARQIVREKEVVLEEWSSVLTEDVDGQIEERLWREAFAKHPYGHSILGSKADIEAVKPETALAFYRRHYGPRRAVVVVAGAFDEAEVLTLIGDSYVDLANVAAERAPLPGDERVTVAKEASFAAPLPAPRVAIALPAPGFPDADRPAFEILAEALAGGRSSRLGASLVVKEGLASSLDSDVAVTTGAGLWTVAAQLHRGKESPEVAGAIGAALARARTSPFTAEEVEAAKNRWESALWQSVRSAEGKADALGSCETLGGDAALFERRLEAVRALTAADIAAVAGRQLEAEGRVQVTVNPAPEPSRPPAAAPPPEPRGKKR